MVLKYLKSSNQYKDYVDKYLMKFLVIIFLLLVQLTYANECQSIIKNPRTYTKWLKIDTSQKTFKDIKKLLKNKAIDEKLDFYYSIHSGLAFRLNAATDKFKAQTLRVARKKGPEAAKAFQQRIGREVTHS